MKAFTLPLLIAAMACPCYGQAQDPFEPDPDKEAAGETDSAVFYGGGGPVDLKSLCGKPIKELRLLGRDDLTDISSVAGLKLEDVMLWKINVADITPLAGMPIKKLVIFGCPVKDLSPLKGMPLESLWVGATNVTDFAPLKGLPLNDLSLYSSEVSDLSPLAGMPLERLDLSVVDSGRISDLTPLKGMKLKRLDLDANTVSKGMDIIRGMKSLEEINRQTPDKFWLKYYADAPARKRLKELGIQFHHLGVADDGSWDLGFHGDDIRDLAVLKGLPVGALGLRKCPTGDLTPLEGSKIERLHLESTAVKDLSSLRKTSLKSLLLFCPEVDDISPLKGMPLEYLLLDCPKVKGQRRMAWLSGLRIKVPTSRSGSRQMRHCGESRSSGQKWTIQGRSLARILERVNML
jgi:hypothetical protein